MTSTSSPLTGAVAVSGDTPGMTPLGYVTWFSVPDRPASLRRLHVEWKLAGLDESILPPEPRPLFLFKRAMREQEGKERHDDGTISETDVRLVSEDHDTCIYQISRVVRDRTNRVIDFPKAMRVVFDKARADEPRPFNFEPLKEVPPSELMPMMHSISDYFDESGKQVDGRKIRAMVRNYLKTQPDPARDVAGLSGLNLRGKAGGVYFVAAQHKDTLDKMASALESIYKDGSAYLVTIPLMDGTDSRELVRRHHVNNSLEEAKDAMAEVAQLLQVKRANGIRADVAQHHWRKLHSLREKAQEYSALLEDEQSEVNDAMDLLKKQLEKLI